MLRAYRKATASNVTVTKDTKVSMILPIVQVSFQKDIRRTRLSTDRRASILLKSLRR